MPEERRITIVLCTKESNVPENINCLKALQIPKGYTVDIQAIISECSFAAAYQQGMTQSRPGVKIYIHGLLRYVNESILDEILTAFSRHPKAGILGLVGSELPLDGNYPKGKKRYGAYYTQMEKDGNTSVLQGEKPIFGQFVSVLDSALLATKIDVPWDEDAGDMFFAAAQCCKMRQAGYEALVPMQASPWVVFADVSDYERADAMPGFEQQRHHFFEAYRESCLPLVSILITTYNQPDYFRQALESALAQDYGNIEIVVGDDSTDERTKELIQPYLEKYPFLRYYFHGKPLGKRGLLNLEFVLNHCSGEYINILFHDDLLYSTKIRRMMEYYVRDLNREIGLVSSTRDLIDEEGECLAIASPWVPEKDTVLPGEPTGRQLVMLQYNFIGELTTVLLRKALLYVPERKGFYCGYFLGVSDTSMGDISTWLHILCGKQGVFIADRLSAFRRHPEQNTYNYGIRVASALDWFGFAVNAWLHGFYIYTDEDLWQALEHWSLLGRAYGLHVLPEAEKQDGALRAKWEHYCSILAAIDAKQRAMAVHLIIRYLMQHALDAGKIRALCDYNAETGYWGKRDSHASSQVCFPAAR